MKQTTYDAVLLCGENDECTTIDDVLACVQEKPNHEQVSLAGIALHLLKLQKEDKIQIIIEVISECVSEEP